MYWHEEMNESMIVYDDDIKVWNEWIYYYIYINLV